MATPKASQILHCARECHGGEQEQIHDQLQCLYQTMFQIIQHLAMYFTLNELLGTSPVRGAALTLVAIALLARSPKRYALPA